MKLTVFGASDRGMIRSVNEDAYFIDETYGALVVADGLGGHKGGDVASRMAITVLHEYIAGQLAADPSLRGCNETAPSNPSQLLASGIRRAHGAILDSAASDPCLDGMGTTIVALLVRGCRAAVAHVGDSRLYLWRDGAMRQMTRDHSLVGEQVRLGIITPEEAEKSPRKNVVTRALGQREAFEIDVQDVELQSGDRLLLCSDGLSGMVPDRQISALLGKSPSPEQACRTLVDAANSNGGRDNVTVIAAFCQQADRDGLSGLKQMFQGM